MNKKKKPLTYKQVLNHHLKILKNLQYPSGLFAASSKVVSTGYDKSWLRDNFYECMAFFVLKDYETPKKTYKALLKIFIKHESKIDHAIHHKPQYRHEYIHARFHPENFNEFWEDWGNKQNDAVGAILFGLGILYEKGVFKELNTDEHYIRIINKLVKYLESVQYWHDYDSGIWENEEEIHASSIGACIAGLKSISKIPNIHVPKHLIENGENSLNNLLPRESQNKFVDLALLVLIFPFDVVNAKQRDEILKNVRYHLERERGVVRYKNDYYYNNNYDGHSEEAEWVFGFAWLAIIYKELGEDKIARKYVNKLMALDTENGLPELYFSNSQKWNENTPLGWTESLFIVALHELHEKHHKRSKNIFSKILYN